MARVHSCSLNRWNWECWNRMEQEHKPKRNCKVCKGWKIHALGSAFSVPSLQNSWSAHAGVARFKRLHLFLESCRLFEMFSTFVSSLHSHHVILLQFLCNKTQRGALHTRLHSKSSHAGLGFICRSRWISSPRRCELFLCSAENSFLRVWSSQADTQEASTKSIEESPF